MNDAVKVWRRSDSTTEALPDREPEGENQRAEPFNQIEYPRVLLLHPLNLLSVEKVQIVEILVHFAIFYYPLAFHTNNHSIMAESSTEPHTTKTPKAQLSKGMEHMRQYVTVEPSPPTTPPIDSADDAQGTPAYGVPAAIMPVRKPATESSKMNDQKRSDPFQFGSRYLEEGDDIFAFNAWDHVEVDDAYKEFIATQQDFQRSAPVSDFDKKRFNDHPEKFWDKFYSNNRANFFKDRKWLVQEFPVLGEVTKPDYGDAVVLEVGAGAGNTAFPVLANNQNKGLRIHACDYSKKAIEVIRANEAYDGEVLRADVWDVSATGENALPPGVKAGSVDVVIMIFIFSALQPTQWMQAVRNVYDILKPGGVVLFRDYGRGDLAQVRFKKGRYLEENFYIRGDGTRVYFFEQDELRDIWSGEMPPNALPQKAAVDEPADQVAEELGKAKLEDIEPVPAFEIINLGVDRRMLVNRQRKLKMYRCWMQGRFQKPAVGTSST